MGLNLDKNIQIYLNYLDFAKAFGVDHKIILIKLNANGISAKLQSWLINIFLTLFEDEFSKVLPHLWSVPQKTNMSGPRRFIGPLMFVIFGNDHLADTAKGEKIQHFILRFKDFSCY